ncbi:MAG: glycosylasparaginase, partial [Bacteroidia bacterium]|nr:glycosylasparaginase [Bacteroidia bacterium]
MSSRREFLKKTGLASSLAFMGFSAFSASPKKLSLTIKNSPVVISTWRFGMPANMVAMKVLYNDGRALDAVEQGVRVPEADPAVTSVGYGGLPDFSGRVTLDACIMDETGNCGSVAFLQNIKHPISVARKVMEDTEHVMLVGQGALQFAIGNGFKKDVLLTKGAEKAFLEHKNAIKKAKYDEIKRSQEEDHDT